MATSSIFHNIIIDDPRKAEAFISAIEASIADPYLPSDLHAIKPEDDPDKIRQIIDLWKREAGD